VIARAQLNEIAYFLEVIRSGYVEEESLIDELSEPECSKNLVAEKLAANIKRGFTNCKSILECIERVRV